MDASALVSAGRGLPCRAIERCLTFQALDVRQVGTGSLNARRHSDAQVAALQVAAGERNAHEVAAHGYHHGNESPPSANPFNDLNGHANKTMRWDLRATS